MTHAECAAKYGPIVDGHWADEAKHCILVKLPRYVSTRVVNTLTGRPWTHVYVNRDMAKELLLALELLVLRGCIDELKTFDGCLNIRTIRGRNVESSHAYAMAIDLNAAENPLGAASSLSADFVRCFTDAGFVWGGTFERIDAQHFSMTGF